MKTHRISSVRTRMTPIMKPWWFLAVICAGLLGRSDTLGQGVADFNPDRILVKPLAGVDLLALNQRLGIQVLDVFPAKIGRAHV